MRCPHCEQLRHLLDFVRLEQVEKYALETNPVYMCPKWKNGCGHIFSPGDHTLLLAILSPPESKRWIGNGSNPENIINPEAKR